jgi:glycerol-3-phosphate acyltransferase PlsX
MRILLDVMGGDLPPEELIKGGIAAGYRNGIDILFAGDLQLIRKALSNRNEHEGERFSILPTTQVVTMNDPPVRAVRSKRDSSLIRGLCVLRDGEVDAFVSPGNTGAVVAGAIFTLGRLSGVLRPGILVSIPTLPDPEILVIDVGANVDCDPDHLVHFALMGFSYARYVLGIDQPTIGLLNIGTEKTKGNKFNKLAFERLAVSPLPFVGNVEGHHLLTERPVDVVVCDGYIGNVLLKALEGGVSAVTDQLKDYIKKSWRAKVGAWFLHPAFAALKKQLSYQSQGGASLLGVNGVVVIAHGRSDAETIRSAITVACRAVKTNVTEQIQQGIAGWNKNGC